MTSGGEPLSAADMFSMYCSVVSRSSVLDKVMTPVRFSIKNSPSNQEYFV